MAGVTLKCSILAPLALWYSSTKCIAFLRMVQPALPLPPIRRSFLFFQMPQQTVVTCSNNPGRRCSHLYKFSGTSMNFQLAEISKGRTNLLFRHTSLAWSQNYNKWQVDSSSFPHNSQTPSSVSKNTFSCNEGSLQLTYYNKAENWENHKIYILHSIWGP